MIKAKGVFKNFEDCSVLRGVDFEVEKGEIIAVIGPSGSGKSTLLRSLIGLEEISLGTIEIDNAAFVSDGIYKPEKTARRIYNKMGMVFQQFNLFPHLSVKDNLTLAPISQKLYSKKEANEKAEMLLKTVGLQDKKDAYPKNLSGGQKQRVAIARALMMSPEILLFDEPTSALDPELTSEVLAVIRDLTKLGITMIIVTHEMNFAKDVASRIIFMDNGVVAADETPGNLFSASNKNERLKTFLGAYSA